MLVKTSGIPVIPTIFDDFFRDWSSTNFSRTNTTLPAVNIKEDDDQFLVKVAVPGMDKKDFNINLDNNILTIQSEKEVENNDENENYTRKEYSYQSFKRSFTLPKNVVDSEKIEANYINGELQITIPKLEIAKPKPLKLIEVH
ncbi:Hsp20/alpha crystallin family protein [Lutibacter sp.]|jgi:HSP20 family protein|uniref:Hsp20/alpha crystallin family protein n=1 Tax=Lutibacter sp. TaxID=1925666 RepID=UPI001A2A4F06|nr:Hsp20/alpha crystallin family protein [Lutibacter sp.]MBI9042436.1 Hsp20/alpha crystallin family protein [Lutibacter sp.]